MQIDEWQTDRLPTSNIDTARSGEEPTARPFKKLHFQLAKHDNRTLQPGILTISIEGSKQATQRDK